MTEQATIELAQQVTTVLEIRPLTTGHQAEMWRLILFLGGIAGLVGAVMHPEVDRPRHVESIRQGDVGKDGNPANAAALARHRAEIGMRAL